MHKVRTALVDVFKHTPVERQAASLIHVFRHQASLEAGSRQARQCNQGEQLQTATKGNVSSLLWRRRAAPAQAVAWRMSVALMVDASETVEQHQLWPACTASAAATWRRQRSIKRKGAGQTVSPAKADEPWSPARA